MTELAYPSGLPSGHGYVRLREIRDCLQPREVLRWRDLAVDGLCFDSKEARAGNLFFAIRGAKNDGSLYAQQAVAKGAVAVVAEEPLALPVPVLVVPSARQALADAARYYYRDPSRAVSVIGVTGTNGKTTTAHLIRACLQADRRQCGLLGTIAYEFGGRRIPASNTTPDPVRLQGYLREMADRYASACVMEVSSHSLDQERVRGVRFATAVFTNLTQDHLDYHGTMAAYGAAKARLFEGLAPGSTAVLNRDDPASALMAEAVPAGVRIVWFGLSPEADIRAENLQLGPDGTRFTLVMQNGGVEMFLRLVGLHNVHNALAAAAAALSLGASELTVASALEDARAVPGRLELVEAPVGLGGKVRTFVDYAHTPMAVAVARHAACAYLTSDNPRSEDPEAILDEVETGFAGAAVEVRRIVDRSEAIRAAIGRAAAGDTVLIAGKGHETYQVFKDSVVPFDDRLEAARALAAREAGWLPR
jgi:UDP-N-acetylmuramoyl-L-alanyl-D-glutamate--2,6-diaminopimelate ligase